MFTFAVYDEDGRTAARASNDINGEIIFPDITITASGIYHFLIKELNASVNGWVMDDTTFLAAVTVSVDDNAPGGLQAEITYPVGAPVFVNRYCPSPCDKCCEPTKVPPPPRHCCQPEKPQPRRSPKPAGGSFLQLPWFNFGGAPVFNYGRKPQPCHPKPATPESPCCCKKRPQPFCLARLFDIF
jgi:pilin isopeptide linkage protein